MQTGTFEINEVVTEQTPHGTFTDTYKKQIVISEENFYGKPQFYQTERVYRNGQIIFSSNYPADTNYAKERRSMIVDF